MDSFILRQSNDSPWGTMEAMGEPAWRRIPIVFFMDYDYLMTYYDETLFIPFIRIIHGAATACSAAQVFYFL